MTARRIKTSTVLGPIAGLIWLWISGIAFTSHAADDCIDYHEYPHLTTVTALPDDCFNICRIGDLALASRGYRGLFVLDMTDPLHLKVLGGNEELQVQGDLAISGQTALSPAAQQRQFEQFTKRHKTTEG